MLSFVPHQTSQVGYYVPFMITGSIASAIASGLMINFGVNTDTGYWIATLIVSGMGFGLAGQQCMMIPQTILNGDDISLGTSVVMFAQTISGTIFLSVCENIFGNQLVHELHVLVPRVDASVIVRSGASHLKENMAEIYGSTTASKILEAYSRALRPVWIIGVVLASLSLLGALTAQWVNVKKVRVKQDKKADDGQA